MIRSSGRDGSWYQSPSESPIYLIGEVSSSAVETALEPADANVKYDNGTIKPRWNLVAAPWVEPVEVHTVLGGNTADEAAVPTGAAPKLFSYKNGSWGYSATEPVIEGGVKVGVRPVHDTTAVKIPAGTGFWYLNNATQGAKAIRW